MSAVVIAEVSFKDLSGADSKPGYAIVSDQEVAMLEALAWGSSNAEVAIQFGVSVFAVLAAKRKGESL